MFPIVAIFALSGPAYVCTETHKIEFMYDFKNSLRINEENTKENHNRIVSFLPHFFRLRKHSFSIFLRELAY